MSLYALNTGMVWKLLGTYNGTAYADLSKIPYSQLYVQIVYDSQIIAQAVVPRASLSTEQRQNIIGGWFYHGSQNVDFSRTLIAQSINGIRLFSVMHGANAEATVGSGALVTAQCIMEVYYV